MQCVQLGRVNMRRRVQEPTFGSRLKIRRGKYQLRDAIVVVLKYFQTISKNSATILLDSVHELCMSVADLKML